MTKQFCQKGDISLVVTFPGFSSCLCYNFDNLNFIILRLSGPGLVHHLKQSARSAGVRVGWSGIHIISNTLTLSQSPRLTAGVTGKADVLPAAGLAGGPSTTGNGKS